MPTLLRIASKRQRNAIPGVAEVRQPPGRDLLVARRPAFISSTGSHQWRMSAAIGADRSPEFQTAPERADRRTIGAAGPTQHPHQRKSHEKSHPARRGY
jgi:hypothetical protein